jgi:phosphate transport system substrate-binding protein
MMMKRLGMLLLMTLAVMASEGVERFKGMEGTLRIAGGTAHIPVMKAVAKEIAAVNPKLRIAIAGGGSGVGIKKVGEGLVDIGNAGRKPTDEEIARYGLKLHKWAIDGIAVVVHPSNPVQSMSREQVRAVFAGKIRNWKELGGPDAPIDLYTRDKASGTRKVFWKKILDKGPISSSADFVDSNGAMKRAVANDPQAIGFMSAGFVDGAVRGVAIDGAAPSRENILSGKYPYVRGIYSLTKGEPEGLAKAFIDYLFSDHVQHEIVAKKGFVPVR